MVAGRPSPAPLGPLYPAGSALGGGWGLLWPYRSRVVGWCLHAVEWIRAGEQPGGQDLSKWGRNGRIEAQRALAAAQVTPMATQKEAGRGKSI